MPTVRYILHMNNGTIMIVYTRLEVELLQGQYKSIKRERMTDEG